LLTVLDLLQHYPPLIDRTKRAEIAEPKWGRKRP
jgi:hypothetical protein